MKKAHLYSSAREALASIAHTKRSGTIYVYDQTDQSSRLSLPDNAKVNADLATRSFVAGLNRLPRGKTLHNPKRSR